VIVWHVAMCGWHTQQLHRSAQQRGAPRALPVRVKIGGRGVVMVAMHTPVARGCASGGCSSSGNRGLAEQVAECLPVMDCWSYIIRRAERPARWLA